MEFILREKGSRRFTCQSMLLSSAVLDRQTDRKIDRGETEKGTDRKRMTDKETEKDRKRERQMFLGFIEKLAMLKIKSVKSLPSNYILFAQQNNMCVTFDPL